MIFYIYSRKQHKLQNKKIFKKELKNAQPMENSRKAIRKSIFFMIMSHSRKEE